MSQYLEDFEEGPGGWSGFAGNFDGWKPLEWRPGSVTSRSPWWIDYNHAPPGAGYLHMIASLNTRGPQTEQLRRAGEINRFIEGGFPSNFIGAEITFTLRGELLDRGARLILLVQGVVDGICSGYLLAGQALQVTPETRQETLSLELDQKTTSDSKIWIPLGARHDRTDMYGVKPLERVLANVSANIMLVMFPLEVVPMGPLEGNPHQLRPEVDYPVWRHKLPEGYVTLEQVSITLHE